MSEKFVTEIITNLKNDTDAIAYDIGANHGIYTVELAKRFKKVYAFEPHPQNIIKLKENTKNFNNVEIVPIAFGEYENENIALFVNPGNPGGHTINNTVASTRRWGHDPGNSISVKSTTIDAFSKDKNVRFIKCDVEGAENFIFHHGKETLKNNQLSIVLETHQTIDCEELFNLFSGLGYTVIGETREVVDNFERDKHYLITKEQIKI